MIYKNSELKEIIEGRYFGIISPSKNGDLFDQLENKLLMQCLEAKKDDYGRAFDRDLDLGIVLSPKLNAFAYASPLSEKPGFDFIGITTGVFYTLTDTFFRMMSHPEIFPDIGNPTEEDKNRCLIPELNPHVMELGRLPCLPKNHTRSAFAVFLIQSALSFIFAHELTHIVHGHLELKRKLTGINLISEVMEEASDRFDPWTLHTLEKDADMVGIHYVIDNAYFNIFNRVKGDLNSDEEKALNLVFKSPKTAIRQILFSVYVLFRLFSKGRVDLLNIDQGSHPPPPVRQLQITMLIESMLRVRNWPYDGNFREDASKILAEAEQACGAIRDDFPDVSGFLSVQEQFEDFKRYNSLLRDKWNEIAPELDAFKRCERPL